ncbi:hypothetical protein B6D60_01650 [candidate division KSB1 bacterium 4484_87]|nr:MAG: hypothetical protein B6D60_01650 [candidate division KSB1 bacterium 4484_87]
MAISNNLPDLVIKSSGNDLHLIYSLEIHILFIVIIVAAQFYQKQIYSYKNIIRNQSEDER